MIDLVVWPRLGDPFVSQNLRRIRMCHSPERIMGCAYTICSHGHTSIFCTIPSGSRCPPSRVRFYTLFFVLMCCNRLCDWSFSLYLHITNIYYFVVSYLFLLLLLLLLLFTHWVFHISFTWWFFTRAWVTANPQVSGDLPGQQNPQFCIFFFFFFFFDDWFGRLAEIRWSVCISKSQKDSYVSFSRTYYGLCIYHLFAWSYFNFLHNSQWITLPTQSCQVLYSFVLMCCNRLCDWSFSLYLHITNIYYFVVSYLFLLLLLLLLFTHWVFHISFTWWFFTRARTLLSILAVLNSSLVWMVSILSPTSKSSSPFNNPLVTVPKAPITIGTIITFMFHSFFNSLAKSRYLSFSHSFSFILWSAETAKSTILQILLLLIIIRSGLLAEFRWSVCMSKSHRSLCVSFSRTTAGLCIYYLFVWSNLNFLHISQWITLPTQLCLVLYSFCANLLHSLIMWLIVSSLSPHSQHLLFCFILSILALIWLVLALFCAAIRRDSLSLSKFLFPSHVQVLLLLLLLLFLSIFFTPALADGLSLEFEWQQVFLILQDSSQYSESVLENEIHKIFLDCGI